MCVTSTSVSRGIRDQGSLPLSYDDPPGAVGGERGKFVDWQGGSKEEERGDRAVRAEGQGG